MMKRAATMQIAGLVIVGFVVAACQDTLIYGESTAFDLAIHVNDSPQSPVEVNAGLKRYAAETAPPVRVAKDEDGADKAAGEAVSSFSGFALTYDREGIFGDLFIRTQFASGFAATALAGDPAEAAKVIQADFARSADFVSEANQLRVQRIQGAIDGLNKDATFNLLCDPAIVRSETADMVSARESICQDRNNPAAAKNLLRTQSFLDQRTEQGLAAWETALNLQ